MRLWASLSTLAIAELKRSADEWRKLSFGISEEYMYRLPRGPREGSGVYLTEGSGPALRRLPGRWSCRYLFAGRVDHDASGASGGRGRVTIVSRLPLLLFAYSSSRANPERAVPVHGDEVAGIGTVHVLASELELAGKRGLVDARPLQCWLLQLRRDLPGFLRYHKLNLREPQTYDPDVLPLSVAVGQFEVKTTSDRCRWRRDGRGEV